VLLTLALPGVWLLGWQLAGGLAVGPNLRHLLAPAAALAALVVAVGALGRASGSFRFALCAGTLALAAMGAAWRWRDKGGGAGEAAPSDDGAASGRRLVLTGAIAALPVAYLTLAADFFDDFNPTGHRSLVAQFQNDVFPPRHQVFPEYPFRYHYGFNLVAAALTAFFRLPVPWAIDLLVIGGFLWSWCLAWRLGERLAGPRAGAWTALAALLGGGAFFWLIGYADWAKDGAVGRVVGGNRLNFPVVMYFFQKPFAIGFPLALALMRAAAAPAEPRRWWRRTWLLAVVLAALYLVQEALFVTVGLSLAAQELIAQRKPRALAPFALALALAVPLGGVLFAAMPAGDGLPLRLRFWPAQGDPGGVLAWYLLTTGLLVPLGIAGLFRMTALRTFFALLMAGSFAAPLVFEDPFSWDIVKLATIGQLAAGLAAGPALAQMAAARSGPRLAVLALTVALIVASPLGYLGYWIREVVRPTPEIGLRLRLQRQLPHNEHWTSLLGWLRRNAALDGTVHAANPRLAQMVLLAGLGGSGPSRWQDRQFGIPRERIARRQAHLQALPPEAARWRSEGVRWVLVGPGDRFDPTVARWVSQGEALPVTSAGPWRLYRLHAPPAAGPPPARARP
jgi:hypothetical protein